MTSGFERVPGQQPRLIEWLWSNGLTMTRWKGRRGVGGGAEENDYSVRRKFTYSVTCDDPVRERPGWLFCTLLHVHLSCLLVALRMHVHVTFVLIL